MISWFSDELQDQRSMQMMMQGGGGIVGSNNGCSSNRRSINGKRSVHPHPRENDADVTTSAGAEARLFSADDQYLGISGIVSDICSSQGNNISSSQAEDEQRSKGKELFFCDDWPQLDCFMDFQADLIRDFDSTFEIGSDSYFQDPFWPSICSLDAQLVVPSSHSDNPSHPSVSVPDTASTEPVFIDQINTVNPINTQQPHMIESRGDDRGEENERFLPVDSSDGDLFCPFSDMLVPASSPSMICSDHEIASSSTTSSWPDQLVAGYAPEQHSRDPSHATPDMILDGMAANPLEMYFPSLTEYEQQQPGQMLVNYDGLEDQKTNNQRLFSEDFAAAGDAALQKKDKKKSVGAGSQFVSWEGRACLGAVSEPENSLSPPLIVLEAVPVKHLGFHKLQEGMNQLDVETKTCIRDALYRLANDVEQRHCVSQLVAGASSGANRLRSGVWTEMTQASPMDRSVAQLLLQKPPCRTTTTTAGCQAKHVAR